MEYNTQKLYQKVLSIAFQYATQLRGWKLTGIVIVFKKDGNYKSIVQNLENNKAHYIDGGLEFFVNGDKK